MWASMNGERLQPCRCAPCVQAFSSFVSVIQSLTEGFSAIVPGKRQCPRRVKAWRQDHDGGLSVRKPGYFCVGAPPDET